MKFNIAARGEKVVVEVCSDDGTVLGRTELDYEAACALIDDINDAAWEVRQRVRGRELKISP